MNHRGIFIYRPSRRMIARAHVNTEQFMVASQACSRIYMMPNFMANKQKHYKQLQPIFLDLVNILYGNMIF